MADKRPHPSNGYTDTEPKRPRLSAEQQARIDAARARIEASKNKYAKPTTPNGQTAAAAAPPSATNGQPKYDIADLKARVAATQNKGGAPAAAPASPAASGSDAPKPAGGAMSTVEALKARMAAAQNRTKSSATPPQDDSLPPQRPPARSQAAAPPPPPPVQDAPRKDESFRGGLHTALHPMLMEGFRSDRDRGKAKAPPGSKQPQQPVEEEVRPNPYLDTSGPSQGAVATRRGRELRFNLKGKYIDQANELRKQAQLAETKARIAAEMRRQALLEDKSEQNFLIKNVPEIEWWDEPLIDGEEYPDFDGNMDAAFRKLKIDEAAWDQCLVTRLVHHPVILDPPFESLPNQAKPMYLTKKEQKKMRLQNRMADLKEKQAKIRLGLQEPDPPKIKKSNLMRVLGNEAVKDPTAVEARVTREIEERAENHEQMNEQRALSKEERHEKIENKAQADAAKGLYQAVYRVGSLAYSKNRSKIDMNAKQCKDLTGIMLTNPNCCCVVVEAGAHTQKFMKNLMLRRIKWNEIDHAQSSSFDRDDRGPPPTWLQAEDEEGKLKDVSENTCVLVWEGEAKQRCFKFWNQRDCETDGAARQTMERNKMENAWVMARSWSANAF